MAEMLAHLKETAQPRDLIVTMGAGDVTMQGPTILNTLAQRGAEAGA